jgi:membrane protein
MADVHDIRPVFRQMGVLAFCKKVWFEIGDDNLFTWASALAYSWLFAVFPFFLVLLSLIPLMKYEWRLEAKNQINLAINQLPHEAKVTVSQYIEPRLDKVLFEKPKGITLVWIVGLGVTLWAASGGMAMTMAAMDRCYDVVRTRPFYKQRPLAVMLTLIVATLILLVVVLIPIGTVVTNFLTSRTERLLVATNLSKPADNSDDSPREAAVTQPATTQAAGAAAVAAEVVRRPARFNFWIVLWQIGRYALGGLFMFWVVGLIYHFGPNVKQKFRIFTPGAIFTVGVWVLLGLAFRLYVDRFGKYGETYGAVGGVIILLFFFYIDALVLLVGAEINAEIDAALRAAAHVREKPPPAAEVVDTEATKETP